MWSNTKDSFPLFRQLNKMDCGPACLKMTAKYYGKSYTLETLRNYACFGREGVSLLGISEAAEKIGFKTRGVKISFDQLIRDTALPCILHWDQNHFIVLPPQKFRRDKIKIADPSKGLISINRTEFTSRWGQPVNQGFVGIALLIEPTTSFYDKNSDRDETVGWRYVLNHVWMYRQYFLQLGIGLIAGSLLQLIFPFFTQGIVDNGINHHDLTYIYIILIGQLMLFFGRTTIDFIRSRILLYISTNINIAILSDFWIKLMRLPLDFFFFFRTGDIMQRISDQQRIQNFLTGSALNTFFSLFNLAMFSVVLLTYDSKVFFIFSLGSILYVIWIRVFLKPRRDLDYRRFAISSKENSLTVELIQGMQEIKLNGAEQLRRWQWERIQTGLFKLSLKSLSLSQYQQVGAFFLNEGKNILITFFVAKAVLEGQLTLGSMMAIQYIIGQLNSPIEQLTGFSQSIQDAKISLERLNDIHRLPEEETSSGPFIHKLSQSRTITFSDVSFTYPGAGNEPVIKNFSLEIPEGQVTAIVGMSGSGKTTILKLLLRFYTSHLGTISVGGINLKVISPMFWRKQCGSVMQDGYIFSDSIENNIALSEEYPDYEKLQNAARISNILPFIESLPKGFKTKIGTEGHGLSQGQKQRLLIARAVYKDPAYLFFDEATNALDANNEKIVMKNLTSFFNKRTVIIIAHRLSTVKSASNILVVHNGEIVENGNHKTLSLKKGHYYELVKNQLELGN